MSRWKEGTASALVAPAAKRRVASCGLAFRRRDAVTTSPSITVCTKVENASVITVPRAQRATRFSRSHQLLTTGNGSIALGEIRVFRDGIHRYETRTTDHHKEARR